MNKITDVQLDALIKSAVNSSGPLPPDEKFSQIISALRELRELRSGMLQGKDEPVSQPYTLPLDYLQGYKDGCEWSALMAEANHPQTGDWLYDDPLELAKAIRKGPDMLPTASDFREIPNSSTNNCRKNADSSTNGWIPCSERMPETDGNYWGWWSKSKRQGPVWFIKSDLQAQFQSSEITHWMPLPAPPFS